MISLIVKGSENQVASVLSKRGIKIHALSNIGHNSCVAVTEDVQELDVIRWFCETESSPKNSMKHGPGYPPGTLLHYTFRP